MRNKSFVSSGGGEEEAWTWTLLERENRQRLSILLEPEGAEEEAWASLLGPEERCRLDLLLELETRRGLETY